MIKSACRAQMSVFNPWLPSQLHSFYQDHVGPGSLLPQFTWLAVLFAIEPFLGAFHGIELENDESLRLPIAFDNFGRAAAHDIFTTAFPDAFGGQFLVFFVAFWFEDFNFNNYVGGHGSGKEGLEGLKE